MASTPGATLSQSEAHTKWVDRMPLLHKHFDKGEGRSLVMMMDKVSFVWVEPEFSARSPRVPLSLFWCQTMFTF